MEKWRNKFYNKEININDLEYALPKIIRHGSRIIIGSGCSEPVVLTEQLVKDQWRWSDCQIIHFFTLSKQRFFSEDFPTQFRHNTLSIIGTDQMRYAINNGKSDFTPIMASEIPNLLTGIGKRIHVDVALVQVSPPDRNGFCSLGINVDINSTIIEVAKTVIAQINPQMPRTMGNSFVRISDIDYFVYHDSPLLEYESKEIKDNYQKIIFKIDEYLSRLIENGSTLNLGIGDILENLPPFLSDKKDLAIYTEVLMESIIPLINEGVINCSKNYYPHCMTTFILGTNQFYKFVDDNPFIEFHSIKEIVNVENMAKNNKLISIYSAFSVDLLGQTTNHQGAKFYGGVGGEADFVRGSMLSKGGKSIITLTSLTPKGRSRIVTLLPSGLITLRAFDVHYVVTEYGIAYLHGKSIRERILQMIGISHPDHRQKLLEQAKKLNYIYKDQKIPVTKDGVVVIYPDFEWKFQTKSKGEVRFRPIKPTDERLMQELYYSLSEQDRVKRFMSPQSCFSHKETQSRINCDYVTNMIIVGIIGDDENPSIVASGGYYLEPNTNLGEIGLTIHGDYQKQGIGTFILKILIQLAEERGLAGMCGEMLSTNVGMFNILNSLPYKVAVKDSDDSVEFCWYFNDKKPSNMHHKVPIDY